MRCKRCKQIKSDNLRLHCECSGEYQMSETRGELLKRLQVTGNVAEWHDLALLASVVDWLKDSVGA